MRRNYDEREQVAEYQSLLNRFWYEVNQNETITSDIKDEIVRNLNEAEQALHFFLMYGEEKKRVQLHLQVIGDLLTHGTVMENPIIQTEKQKKSWFF
jgi:hypothetical protein